MNYLRTKRLGTALSQGEVGFLLGLGGGGNVSRHESGGRLPDLRTLLAYATLYGAGVDELFAEDAREVEVEIRRRAGELLARARQEAPSPSRKRRLEALGKLSGRSRRKP